MQNTKTILITAIVLFFGLQAMCQSEYQQYTYPNGQISSEGLLRDGKPDGLWKTYYENGQLKSIGKRTDFLLDSTWVFFADNGDTSLVINYKKDLKNGPRTAAVGISKKAVCLRAKAYRRSSNIIYNSNKTPPARQQNMHDKMHKLIDGRPPQNRADAGFRRRLAGVLRPSPVRAPVSRNGQTFSPGPD